MSDNQCSFIADVIVKNGRGYKRIPNVQCMAEQDHTDEHEFNTHGAHVFGVSFEKGRYVARQ